MPEEPWDMAESICGQFLHTARRLTGLGLGVFKPDRRETLSTGNVSGFSLPGQYEAGRREFSACWMSPRLDCIRPMDGLLGMMTIAHGNSVVLVDHDTGIEGLTGSLRWDPSSMGNAGRKFKDVKRRPLIAGFLTGGTGSNP